MFSWTHVNPNTIVHNGSYFHRHVHEAKMNGAQIKNLCQCSSLYKTAPHYRVLKHFVMAGNSFLERAEISISLDPSKSLHSYPLSLQAILLKLQILLEHSSSDLGQPKCFFIQSSNLVLNQFNQLNQEYLHFILGKNYFYIIWYNKK